MRFLTPLTPVIFIVPVLVACGSSGGSGNGSSSETGDSGSSGPSTQRICRSNTVQITGTIDGANALGNYGAPGTYEFEQTGTGTFTVYFGTNGLLTFGWSKVVPDDQTTTMAGSIVMPDEGPHPGQSYCIRGTVTPHSQSEGGGLSCTITEFAKGDCSGTTVSGSLEGCFSD